MFPGFIPVKSGDTLSSQTVLPLFSIFHRIYVHSKSVQKASFIKCKLFTRINWPSNTHLHIVTVQKWNVKFRYFRVYNTCTLRRSPYESPCLFSKTIIFVDEFIISSSSSSSICLGAHLQTIANYMLI